MVLAPEAIARRNAAAIEPDRIQTRCRDDGARAQAFATTEQVSRTAGLSVRRAILIGTLSRAYHVVLQRNNGQPDLNLT
jgi:hypothetical protein